MQSPLSNTAHAIQAGTRHTGKQGASVSTNHAAAGKADNYFCLILAGGVGSRLWPASRENKPKQFLDLVGSGLTLVQQTYERFARFIDPSHIFISTQERYLPILNQQLPQIPRAQILAEPVRRGTLAPVAWATSAISHLCPDACIVVTPSDQEIYNDDAFAQDILYSLNFVRKHHGVVTMGVRPTRPDTGFGYVQAGEAVPDEPLIRRVKTFTEKPDSEFARMFLDSGEFYWNTGLFVFGAHYMMTNIIKHVPEYRDEFPELADLGATATTEVVPKYYDALPMLSMESAVLERTGHSYILPSHFGWADLGSWKTMGADSVLASSARNTPVPPTDVKVDGRNNVTLHSEALFDNAQDNIVRLPDGHLAVISGLDGFVITEEAGVIMICPKDDDAAMRRLRTLAHLDSLG